MSVPPAAGSSRLFWLACGLAGLLAALVTVAPLLDGPSSAPNDRHPVALFARDVTLRRTCLASAAGLLVSAFVFFQPGFGDSHPSRQAPPRRPRSGAPGA